MLSVLARFSRPHTIIATSIQVVALFLIAGGSQVLSPASLGVVLGATYMLRLAKGLLYGTPAPAARQMADLRGRELLALAPLLALILWVGVWPAPLMSKVESAVSQLARHPTSQTPTLSRTAAIREASHGN